MPAPDGGAFRRAAGRLPTGIVVVCTSLHGIGHAMTVSAFTSVSLEPLLVLFCAEKIARFHDAVLDAGRSRTGKYPINFFYRRNQRFRG